MRAWLPFPALAVAGCVSSGEPAEGGPSDGGVDLCGNVDAFACTPATPADASPPDAAPPVTPCADDAGPWTTDPCDRWTACVADDGGLPWAITYAGACGDDGLCHFATTPVDLHRCVLGCISPGPYGHCGHTGPTVP